MTAPKEPRRRMRYARRDPEALRVVEQKSAHPAPDRAAERVPSPDRQAVSSWPRVLGALIVVVVLAALVWFVLGQRGLT